MAADYFIQIEGIDGESNDKSHQKWIEVISFSHGTMQNIISGRPTDVTGRGQFIPFVFRHLVDKASPKLMQFCMSGQKVAKVRFHVCRAIGGAQTPVYEVTMENVKITKTTISCEKQDTSVVNAFESFVPVEDIELVVGKMTWKVTAIKPDNTKDGAVETSFNQVENA